MLTPDFRAAYVAIDSSPDYQRFQAMEDQISASTGSGPIPVNPSAWESASGAYLAALAAAEDREAVQLAAMAGSQSSGLVTEAVLVGGVGLLAVVGSVFLLVWFGRKVTGDLTRLHGSVRAMAEERLPRVVERLGRGEDVDVLAESPPPGAEHHRGDLPDREVVRRRAGGGRRAPLSSRRGCARGLTRSS